MQKFSPSNIQKLLKFQNSTLNQLNKCKYSVYKQIKSLNSKQNINMRLIKLNNLKNFKFSETKYIKKKEGQGTGIPTNMGFDHVGIVVPNVQEAADFLIDVFDAEFDWEVVREPEPKFGERGWDTLFGTHPETYMPHVMMLKVGDGVLTQYVELFEFNSPDQYKPTQSWDNWLKFSDIGNSYIGFTVKDLNKVIEHLKTVVFPKYQGMRFIQDPPMNFPLRGEVCQSFFIVSPWGQWIELSEWSESKNLKPEILAQRKKKINPLIGKNIMDLPTPSYIIDLDKVDHNIELMQQKIQKDKNIDWRIPVKAHKCPELAHYIVNKANLKGIEVLTLTEAEQFAQEGHKNIYLANVVKRDDLKRLSLLPKKIDSLRVCVEDEDYIQDLADAITQWEITSPIEVLVEINIGHNRCGVTPEESVNLVKKVLEIQNSTGALIFKGITGYEGHTPVLEPEAKTKETIRCHNVLKEAQTLIQKELGIQDIGVISAGGSCNYVDAINAGVINEVQAGGGALCDLLYQNKANLGDHGHQIGSYLLTEIISVSKDKSRVMGNAGFKATGWHPFGGLPGCRDRKDVEIVGLSAEHTKFVLKENSDLKRGDKVVMIPGYSDAMGFLHRQIIVTRNDTVVDVWKTISGETWN